MSRTLASAGRQQLIGLLSQNKAARNEWIRRQVLQNNRIDILQELVLGYVCVPAFHRKIIIHQLKNHTSMTLAYRGGGKTTTGTIVKAIHSILKYPDVKILIASKTAQNSIDFLKEIKQHFESNETLRDIFGDFVGESKWDNASIEVKGRTRPWKEPTIGTVGMDGAVASKHWDIILADDLVDEENSRTKVQREHMLNWYYKVLLPTLRPPELGNDVIGQLHLLGTRYHYEDLYGHLGTVQPDGTGGDMIGKTLIIPALQPVTMPNGLQVEISPWPDRHSPAWFQEKRKLYGLIRFNSQYQCDTEAMKGQIFRYDDFQVIDAEKATKLGFDDAPVYMGVDLAIGEKDQNDMFAIVVQARKGDLFYTKDIYEGRLRFADQTAKIVTMAEKHKVSRIAVEINAYQKAQYHELKRLHPTLNVLPITTSKDKVSRAWKLAAAFENQRHFFAVNMHKLIEHMVLFPGYRFKDLFDAFDLCVSASDHRQRKPRTEPGLL